MGANLEAAHFQLVAVLEQHGHLRDRQAVILQVQLQVELKRSGYKRAVEQRNASCFEPAGRKATPQGFEHVQLCRAKGAGAVTAQGVMHKRGDCQAAKGRVILRLKGLLQRLV